MDGWMDGGAVDDETTIMLVLLSLHLNCLFFGMLCFGYIPRLLLRSTAGFF